MDDNNSNVGTVWNMDDAESQLIFGLKKRFLECMQIWDLDNAFWAYKHILMERKPLFRKQTEIIGDINNDLKELSDKRGEQLDDKDVTKEEQGQYYQLLEEKYVKICDYIVENQLYFRKKEQYRGL